MMFNEVGIVNVKYKRGSIFYWDQFQGMVFDKRKGLLLKDVYNNYKDTSRTIGKRPYIIISSDELNEISKKVIAVPLSSAKSEMVEDNIWSNYTVQFNGFHKYLSTIIMSEIVTVDKFQITEIKAVASERLMQAIDKVLENVFHGSNSAFDYSGYDQFQQKENNDELEDETEAILNSVVNNRRETIKTTRSSFRKKCESKYGKIEEVINENESERIRFIRDNSVKNWSKDDIDFFIELCDRLSEVEVQQMVGWDKRYTVRNRKRAALDKLSIMLSD